MTTGDNISTIIPVHNGERYLAEAIESVLAQSLPPTELVVVDDGSTDGSAIIALSFAPTVRYLRQPNLGPAAARNLGIRSAQGDVLAFLDADDLWLPEKLARQTAALQTHPELETALGHVEAFISPDIGDDVAARLRAQHTTYAGYHVGTLLIRREAFLRVGVFDASLHFGEFIDWWARAMDCGLIYTVLPDVVMRRRLHSGNYTAHQPMHKLDYARVARAALARRRRG